MNLRYFLSIEGILQSEIAAALKVTRSAVSQVVGGQAKSQRIHDEIVRRLIMRGFSKTAANELVTGLKS